MGLKFIQFIALINSTRFYIHVNNIESYILRSFPHCDRALEKSIFRGTDTVVEQLEDIAARKKTFLESDEEEAEEDNPVVDSDVGSDEEGETRPDRRADDFDDDFADVVAGNDGEEERSKEGSDMEEEEGSADKRKTVYGETSDNAKKTKRAVWEDEDDKQIKCDQVPCILSYFFGYKDSQVILPFF
jgi:hypothetical protein